MDRKPERAWRLHSGYCARRWHHPHLHCLVPAGGLSPDRSRWVHSRRRFFLPGPVLGRMFRGKFLALLAVAFRRKKLRLVGELQALERPGAFDLFVSSLKKPKWV